VRMRSVASIPSKFETVLHDGGREKDGFWTRTHRFSYTDNDLPGPGTYVEHRSAETDKTSYSKKGYTGMVSKSSRFTRPRRATAPPPGWYDPQKGFDYIYSKKDPSLGTSSAFAKPIVSDEAKAQRRNTAHPPGPGQYEIETKAKRAVGKQAPFQCGTDRWGTKITVKRKDGTLLNDMEPPPPEVDISDDNIYKISGAFARVYTSKVPSAAFASRTGRKFDRMKGESSIVDTLKPHPSQGPSLGIQVDIKGVSNANDPIPGPGAYEPYLADNLLTLEKLRHSSMFSRTTLDRFGKPVKPKAYKPDVPGPGAYDPPPPDGRDPSVRVEASSASFLSASDRNFVAGKRPAPGPAYYNPTVPGRKSFHLNVQRRWL